VLIDEILLRYGCQGRKGTLRFYDNNHGFFLFFIFISAASKWGLDDFLRAFNVRAADFLKI